MLAPRRTGKTGCDGSPSRWVATLIACALEAGKGRSLPANRAHRSWTSGLCVALGLNQILPSTVMSAAISRVVSSTHPRCPVTETSTLRQPSAGEYAPCWGQMIE